MGPTLVWIACLLSSSVAVARDSTSKETTTHPTTAAPNRGTPSGDNTNEEEAVEFLKTYEQEASCECHHASLAQWNYQSNLTEHNKQTMLEAMDRNAKFEKEAWKKATSFAWKNFTDLSVRRQFRKISILGEAILPEEKFTEMNKLQSDMEDIYGTAKVRIYKPKEKECLLSLEPELTEIFAKSRNSSELEYYWEAWRKASGKKMREKYIRFVELNNEAAKLNGFSDAGEYWRDSYESDTFERDVRCLWDQLKPLYENLHAYVRRKLIEIYPDEKIKPNGPIPAHLLGNMWAQTWGNLLELVEPCPEKQTVDITPEMKRKKTSQLEMFKISEDFFKSLRLYPMTPEFWRYSIIKKPTDRELVCHASAWDMCDGKDFRIKQCTVPTMDDLITVHHEMGHIQYFQQYAHQPITFRNGANPGFHEAIGDVLALSVATPKHLQKIGFLPKVEDDPDADLNFLMSMALDKIAFLPFGFLVDQWRWNLFRGDTPTDKMNDHWWALRLKYQGICPPVRRTELDFDPGAKYHIPGNTPYIRYFVSFVIQFQFHKALCEAAGHEGPLHRCDIYGSEKAGKQLGDMLKMGSSKPWQEAMAAVTKGKTNKMDAQPLMEYFQPLIKWLVEQNKNETLGWKSLDHNSCP